ncbi:DUF4262 domain-containing protein [Streptomyces galilaeus]|uniref:DUF4262 domain-containing protein n=1 Tax=Streptomyces galilaeus TaxID=33899 RepID=A0ABW9ILT5_STRGJ
MHQPGALLQLVDVSAGRLQIDDGKIPLAVPVCERIAAYLDHRAASRLNTASPHRFINRRSAVETRKVGRRGIKLLLGPGVRCRSIGEDRILAETMAGRADARRLHDMCGMPVNAGLRYADVVDRPGFAGTSLPCLRPACPRNLTVMPTGCGPALCHCIVCQDIEELDPRVQSTVDVIEQHGWQVTMVPVGRNEAPGWAYTIGLWHQYRIPELAMFGLDIHLMQTLLNGLARRAVEGHALKADQERHDVANVPIMLKAVDYRWYKAFFGTAIGYYRRPPFPFLQVVWPSRDGAFPWQPGGEDLLDRQPQLALRPEEHRVGVWTQDL